MICMHYRVHIIKSNYRYLLKCGEQLLVIGLEVYGTIYVSYYFYRYKLNNKMICPLQKKSYNCCSEYLQFSIANYLTSLL